MCLASCPENSASPHQNTLHTHCTHSLERGRGEEGNGIERGGERRREREGGGGRDRERRERERERVSEGEGGERREREREREGGGGSYECSMY